MATLDYYGHSTFGLTTDDGTRVIIDPFFEDNPWTEVGPSDVEAFRTLVGDRARVEIIEPGKGSYEL